MPMIWYVPSRNPMRSILSILALALSIIGASAQTAQRWKKVALPAPYDGGYYLDIFFLPSNPNLGWACDQNQGYVVRTTDGGASWRGTTVLGGGSCHLEYIQFLDANVGYCSGPCGMFKSTDGGATWSSIKPAGSPLIWGGWFRSATEGWFTGGGCGSCTFLKTTDGGATFTTVTDTTIKRSILTDPYWAADMAPGEVFAIGSGTLWRSDDYGDTWQVHAYTGTNSPWHEELAMVGQSVLIPNDRERCGSPPVNPGMRFSPDRGQTWRNFATGVPMYGTFLHDAQRGWAAGQSEAVYYTSDAGQTWVKRSCGLEGASTDDIFFVDDDNGWVAGQGLFRTAPALRTQTDTIVRFLSVCPDSTARDTVRFRNVNWFASPWTATIAGPDAGMFSIANAPLATTIGSCANQNVIVQYRPTSRASHSAALIVTFQQPDTTLVVQLEGTPSVPTANPIDTVVTFTAPVGQPLAKTLVWRSSSSSMLESIISISYAGGDTTISMTAARYPEIVRSDVTLTYINAVPQDTGWTQARFRVRLGPCPRDTIITVRIYGLSPIITCPSGAFASAGCSSIDTLRVPISNTGNAALEITSLKIDQSASTAFSIVGFTSGRKGMPWMIPVGERDTILIAYRSDRGRDVSTLEIISNDRTRKRGVKTPWYVALQGLSDRPRITIDKRIINLGSLCRGSVVERNINVSNGGLVLASVAAIENAAALEVRPGSIMDVPPGQTRQIVVAFTPTNSGPFSDTVFISIEPCDTIIPVVVTGVVEDPLIQIEPAVVRASGMANDTLRGRAVIRLVRGDSVRVSDIRISPLPAALRFTLPSLPRILIATDSIVVNLTYSTPVPSEYRGVIEVVGATSCTTRASSEIHFVVSSNEVEITPDTVFWSYRCENKSEPRLITVLAKGTIPVTVKSVRKRSAASPFFVTGPGFPLIVNPGEQKTITIEFTPSAPGRYFDTLDVETTVDGMNPVIPLRGEYLIGSVATEPRVLDLGEISICASDTSFPVRIRNSGMIDHTATVGVRTSLGTPTISRSSMVLKAGEVDSVWITIIPTSYLPNTTVSGVVNVQEDACGRRDSTVFQFFAKGPVEPILQPNPLDAGIVTIGARAVGSITVENPSADTMTILSAELIPQTAEWRITQSITGVVITPFSSATVDVEYVPLREEQTTVQLVVLSTSGCLDTTASVLTGRGREPRAPVTYRIPLRVDEYTVLPRIELDIPIHLSASVLDAKLDSIQWTIRYQSVNLDVDSIVKGNAPDVRLEARMQPGSVVFTAHRAGPQFGTAGTLAVMKTTTRSAVPDSTPLQFTDITAWSPELTQVEHDDGYVIVDACGPRFLIGVAPKSRFSVVSPTPLSSSNVSIRVEADDDDVVDVHIVDALGRTVASYQRIVVGKGLSQLDLDVAHLSAGTYILHVLSNSRGSLTSTIPIVR